MSPPRSGQGASRPAARPAAGRPGVFFQKPKPDIYVALLGTALGALLLGCLLMILLLNRYEFKTKATGWNAQPAPTLLAAAPEKISTVRL